MLKKSVFTPNKPKLSNVTDINYFTNFLQIADVKKIKKYGIIIANPSEVWPVCTLPTRGLKLYTLPT